MRSSCLFPPAWVAGSAAGCHACGRAVGHGAKTPVRALRPVPGDVCRLCRGYEPGNAVWVCRQVLTCLARLPSDCTTILINFFIRKKSETRKFWLVRAQKHYVYTILCTYTKKYTGNAHVAEKQQYRCVSSDSTTPVRVPNTHMSVLPEFCTARVCVCSTITGIVTTICGMHIV